MRHLQRQLVRAVRSGANSETPFLKFVGARGAVFRPESAHVAPPFAGLGPANHAVGHDRQCQVAAAIAGQRPCDREGTYVERLGATVKRNFSLRADQNGGKYVTCPCISLYFTAFQFKRPRAFSKRVTSGTTKGE